MKSKQFKSSTLSFHQEHCIHHLLDDSSCHFCLDACPYQALILDNHKIHIQPELCQDCGRCINACPSNAFYLHHPVNHYNDNTLLFFACHTHPLNHKLSKNLLKSPCYLGLNPYYLANLIALDKKLIFLYDETLCQNCHQFHKDFLFEALGEIFMAFQTEKLEVRFIDQRALVDFLQNHTRDTNQTTRRRTLLKSSLKLALSTSINYLGDQTNLSGLREDGLQKNKIMSYKWQTLNRLREKYPLKTDSLLPLLSIGANNCNFCGHCVRLCPTKALNIIRKDKRYLVWTPTKCENCNFCIESCPKHYLNFNFPLSTNTLKEASHYILWQETPYDL